MSGMGAEGWATLAALFEPANAYEGYKPEIREAPNGDTKACAYCRGAGNNPDQDLPGCAVCHGTGRVPNVDAGRAGKRYLHVALKYKPPAWALEYLARAHWEACRVATALGVPAAYRPHEAFGALRVLEYPSAGHTWASFTHGRCRDCGAEYAEDLERTVCPALAPGAGTAEHTDSNLFTIVLWRSHPGDLEIDHGDADEIPRTRLRGLDINPGLHIGEIGELVGLGPATPHRVPARPYAQKSLIYFAIPDHGARLPCTSECAGAGRCPAPPTVGEWLKERMSRSRYEAQP